MPKHIVDRPRERSDDSRMEHYTELDRKTGGGVRPQADAIRKAPKGLDSGERLKRFVDIDRQGD